MKKRIWIKLFTALIAVSMLLSLFACDRTKDPVDTDGESLEQNTSTDTEGKDFYEIYKDPYEVYEELTSKGYTGTFEEWVASLKGADGKDGVDGADGKDGVDGKSAYELAVEKGYTGTEDEWIASLAGTNGSDGKSAYELAVENGFEGTVNDWLLTLVGAAGADGKDGANGSTPYIKNGNWWIGMTDTGVSAEGSDGAKGDKGDKGDKGEDGADGKDGITPHIGKNGNWWIGTTDTGVKAAGSSSGSSTGSGLSDDNIITLNKDMEPYVIQGASGRPEAFGDKYSVLQFVHASDMHKRDDMWSRMVEWINYYDKYVSFAIHTGDYVGGTQAEFVNMYEKGGDCDVPILNLPGNHDTMLPGVSKQQTATKQSVYDIICGEQCKDWGVTFMPGEYTMAYYKDFPESNIRLIAFDQYYDIEDQKVWAKGLLDEALEKGLHVITAMHEPSGAIAYPLDTSFHTYNYDLYSVLGKHPIEDVIAEFINKGGVHVVNLVGHEHHDLCGYTMNGVLNIAVESGTPWDYWCDGVRVEGTKTFDAFNVVSVDVNAGVLKVVRIGNNTDPYMRTKEPLCYDYVNKKIIAGGTVQGDGDSSSGMPEDTYEVPEFVNAYIGAKYLATRPAGATYQVKDNGLITEDGVIFTRISGQDKVGQIFWSRIGFDGTGAPWPAAQINPIEVGKARYLVLKMRGQVNISNIDFAIGTIVGDATHDNIANMKHGGIKIPQNKLSADEWSYFVFDLSGTYGDYWVADSEGNYKVCYLQFTMNGTFASDMYLDLASMAFLDDWSEVSDYLDVDTVDMVYASNASAEVDVATGKCKDAHALAETVSENKYTYKCALCDTVIYEKTVPESVNWYAPLAAMNRYQNSLEMNLYDSENGIIFNRFSGNRAEHINITGGTGAGTATAESIDTGNYLIMKYRATSDGSVGIYASTNASKSIIGNQTAAQLPGNVWRVAVIDLSHATNYERDAEKQIYIMLNPAGSTYTFDIAYVAIVDDLSEARELITDATFELYTNGWSVSTTENTAGGSAPETPTETTTEATTEGQPTETETASEEYNLTAQDIYSAASVEGNTFASVELKNDGDFDYVQIKHNTAAPSSFWAVDYADAQGNSGAYMIMKYRTNLSSGWTKYALSGDELETAYFSSIAQKSWLEHTYDEQWHVVIVDMTRNMADNSKILFNENENGQYSPKFFAFKPFEYNATEGAYMDFAYVKWAVTLDEAYELIGDEASVDAGYYSGGKWLLIE